MITLNNASLAPYNSYGIEAVAETIYMPQSEDDVVQLFSKGWQRRLRILGRGYNIILSKSKYTDIAFVVFGDAFSKIDQEGSTIRALSGTDMRELSQFAASHSLTGLEVFCDIPSSLGGAVYMNASAGGFGLDASLAQVDVFDTEAGALRVLETEECGFGYRRSRFQSSNEIIVGATFGLNIAPLAEINARMDEIKESRHAKQPRDYPNAGSVFKRPEGHYVGTMIEELGLKGFRVGDAQISEKHAGFIVNRGHATGGQILELITQVQRRVKAFYGVDLELEQHII